MKTNGTPLPDEPPLAAALRACADGLYPAEAAAELLIGHASWLCRDDFRDGFVDVGTSITDGTTLMAAVDWPAAITALDGGGLPASGGERRVLRLAASLADGIPVDLRDAFTGMDAANVGRAVRAMLHASGRVTPTDSCHLACPVSWHLWRVPSGRCHCFREIVAT